MNETIENIISRRSVKKYLDRPVPVEMVEEVVKAGTYAPSLGEGLRDSSCDD